MHRLIFMRIKPSCLAQPFEDLCFWECSSFNPSFRGGQLRFQKGFQHIKTTLETLPLLYDPGDVVEVRSTWYHSGGNKCIPNHSGCGESLFRKHSGHFPFLVNSTNISNCRWEHYHLIVKGKLFFFLKPREWWMNFTWIAGEKTQRTCRRIRYLLGNLDRKAHLFIDRTIYSVQRFGFAYESSSEEFEGQLPFLFRGIIYPKYLCGWAFHVFGSCYFSFTIYFLFFCCLLCWKYSIQFSHLEETVKFSLRW